MPAVQCPRGMNSPANGIFFPRPASLIGGMTRQATQGGRPRARPPPVLPKGGARRGGSKVRERCKRATGRSPLTSGSEPADGRSLRGSGSVFGKRQDVMCRRAAAERIERRPLRRAENDAPPARLTAQQAHRMPPDTIATGMPVRLLPGQCASRCRRVDSACLRRPDCGPRVFPGARADYRNGAAPCRRRQGRQRSRKLQE